ncbi:hypothetical protein S245_059299, partial [Arachis hypogaea]
KHWKAKSSSKRSLQFSTMEFALLSKDPSTCRFGEDQLGLLSYSMELLSQSLF